MRTAIYTRYTPAERTVLAIDIAARLRQFGAVADIHALYRPARGIDPYWDSRIICRSARRHNRDWWRRYDQILWMERPQADEVRAFQHFGVKTAYWCNWEEIRPKDLPALSLLDRVIFPVGAVARAIAVPAQLSGNQILFGPPALAPRIDHGPKKPVRIMNIIVPGHMDLAYDLMSDWLKVVEAVLQDGHMVTVTRGAGWPVSWCTRIKQLRKRYGGSLLVLKHPARPVWYQLLRSADCLLWLGFMASYATVVLDAAAAGTPVIALDIEPVSSYIQHQRSGYLLRCAVMENWNGLPAGLLTPEQCITQVRQALALTVKTPRVASHATRIADRAAAEYLATCRQLATLH